LLDEIFDFDEIKENIAFEFQKELRGEIEIGEINN